MAWNVSEKRGETVRNKTVPLRPGGKESAEGSVEKGKRQGEQGGGARDLAGGMEILEREFLLDVVENTKGDDRNDISMRKLSFNEMIRREDLNEIDSGALKVYAKDADRFYGKNIQCAAMKELTMRTSHKGK